MPFLHWFKRKSESTENEAKPVRADKFATQHANTPETVAANLQPETTPGNEPSEQVSADRQTIAPNPVIASQISISETSVPLETTHISVPIGAFYAKLPAHLLTSKKPDLARSVWISEEDVVLNQETREVTLPLSILSLSCPEIFVRAVDGAEDIPVTFSLSDPKVLEPPPAEEIDRLRETEAPVPPVSVADVEDGEPSDGSEKEIRLRLQPILSVFPPNLEPPSIDSLIGTQDEIALPLGLIQSQLAHGRVVVPAEIFCGALSSDLKPYFAGIDPAAEIPIPLQEVFSRLPPEAIKLREDQEIDRPEESIPSPFSAHAEEDAKRFSEVPAGETLPANETLQLRDESPKTAIELESRTLQAIFMTDEPLDLIKTINKVAELPGLRSCILSTTDGLRLAGNLDDPVQEKAISGLLPELFRRTRLQLELLGVGMLETITLHYGLHQLSTFVKGNLCLTVLHDNRPFKPGVREKIQAVMSELATLSASEKPL